MIALPCSAAGVRVVLVEPDADGGYQIITKSDLISALAGADRKGDGFNGT